MKHLLKSMLFVFVFCIIIFQPHDGSCIDPGYPQIGKEIPDFTLDTISNYTMAEFTRDDMKGQYYILDFWSSNCAACVASFPKVNQLQKKYKDNLQIFLVGKPDKVIEKLYEKLRIRNKLDLSVGYSRKMVDAFVPWGFPYLIWVDRTGIVKAITTSQDLTESNIENFLIDKPFSFTDYSYIGLKNNFTSFDWKLPYLINGNGGPDTSFSFRSLLSKWKKGMPFFTPPSIQSVPDEYYNPGGYQLLKVKLVQLYNLAYYGEYYPREDTIYYDPILEIEVSSAFRIDTSTWDGYYCYSLILPKEKYNKENLMKFLQKDLECYFPYKARIEKRVMPCYVLRVVDEDKTKNLQKKNERDFVSNYMEKEYNNYTTLRLAKIISHDLPGKLRIFDETKIDYNINIKMEALMTDINEVKSELNKYGLDLIPSTKQMSVLVISE